MTISNATAERDECIIEMLDEAAGMIANMARKLELDIEDCKQEAACEMLEAWVKIPANVRNVKGYLQRCIRNRILQFHQRVIDDMLSLEQERTDDGATLLDLLQVSGHKRSEDELDYLDKLTEVTHAALRECRLEEQEYARTAFELTAYMPVAPTNHPLTDYTRKKDKPRRTDNLLTSIKRVFGKHPQVLSLIQRETCVL